MDVYDKSSAIARQVADDLKLSGRSMDFLLRVYSGGVDRYVRRLCSIGFTGIDRVLDAGSGFGQWSLAMSRSCGNVFSLEYSDVRCEVLRECIKREGVKNIHVLQGSVASLPFPNGFFDAVFCYSVIYQTDWVRSIEEFARVLVPGGVLYVSVNGIGWTLYNLVKNPNSSDDFCPRHHALKSLVKTVSRGILFEVGDWILSPRELRSCLKRSGFGSVRMGGDSTLSVNEERPGPQFYPSRYLGFSSVFEALARKEK